MSTIRSTLSPASPAVPARIPAPWKRFLRHKQQQKAGLRFPRSPVSFRRLR
jgi:hypothetical protein